MPKKTKREKILAQQHRQNMMRQTAQMDKLINTNVTTQVSHVPQFQFRAQPSIPSNKTTTTLASGELIDIQKDLIKTVFLAFFAIVSELVLSKLL